MRRYWFLYAIWLSSLIVGWSATVYLGELYQTSKDQLLNKTLQMFLHTTTYSEATSKAAFAAIDFEFSTPSTKENIRRQYGLSSLEYDFIDAKAEPIRIQRPFTQSCFIIACVLSVTGLVISVLQFVLWLAKRVQSKEWDHTYLLRGSITFVSVVLVIIPTVWALNNISSEEDHWEAYAMGEAYSASYEGLIELSNEIATLDTIKSMESVAWFAQVGVIKKKAGALKSVLENKKHNDLVGHAIEICGSLLRWAELITNTSKNEVERAKSLGDSQAEFLAALDLLDKIRVIAFQHKWGLFPRYTLPCFQTTPKRTIKPLKERKKPVFI
jgi:hypothetical protein